IRSVWKTRHTIWALVAIAPHLEDSLRQETIRQILSLLQYERHDSRLVVDSIEQLACYLNSRDILDEALTLALSVGDPKDRAHILAAINPSDNDTRTLLFEKAIDELRNIESVRHEYRSKL